MVAQRLCKARRESTAMQVLFSPPLSTNENVVAGTECTPSRVTSDLVPDQRFRDLRAPAGLVSLSIRHSETSPLQHHRVCHPPPACVLA